MDIKLRLADPSDASSLLEIYRPYVEATAVSFECEVPSEAEFRERICDFSSEFPYIVCEFKGRPIGYAYARRYKARHAYRFSAELSIYIDMNHRSRGIGRILYGALIDCLVRMGYKNLYGIVTDPNPASFALHKSLGFSEAGREHLIGFKFGEWHDVVLFERTCGEKITVTDPTMWDEKPTSVKDAEACVHEILASYEKAASPL